MSDAFRDGIVALIPTLRAYGTMLTGATSEADDLVQDALVRAWRFQNSYVPETNLKAWLFTILRNEFISQARIRQRTVQDVDGKYAALLVSIADQDWRLAHRELLAALRVLTPDTRVALLLVTVSGFTYHEAATLCGCAVGTLKSRVNRARQRLAELIDFEPHRLRIRAPAPDARWTRLEPIGRPEHNTHVRGLVGDAELETVA